MSVNHDSLATGDISTYPGCVFAHILLGSWNYYQQPSAPPLYSDEFFDWMCKYALQYYDELDHIHAKQYIDKDDLRAGSLFALASYDYPLWCVNIAAKLTKELEDRL